MRQGDAEGEAGGGGREKVESSKERDEEGKVRVRGRNTRFEEGRCYWH